ncbi:hypothetical protein L1887_59924 [Cichorium endivia]|nr:hypothetical protein L1887_59924 [Cichorium endivia]
MPITDASSIHITSSAFGRQSMSFCLPRTSLLKVVEPKQSLALNEKPDRRLHDILAGPSGGKWLESDADDQLLISLSFKQQVKLSGILLRTLPSHLAHAPRQVRIFVNRPGLGFDDATTENADQEFELSDEHVRGAENGGGGKAYSLRFVKFQKVDSLTIAVLSNQEEAETTRIDAIDVFGITNHTTDMSELQKIAAEGRGRDSPHRPASRTGLKGGSPSSAPAAAASGFAAPRSSSIPNISTYTERPARHTRSHSTSSLNPPMPRYRRSASSSSAPPMHHLSEEEEEDAPDFSAKQYTRQNATQPEFVPHAPPSMTEGEEAEFEAAQSAARDTLGGWHYAPLAVALAPPLGALLGGHSDAWSDAILLILASFWLYQFLRVPWEIYYASRTRQVLAHDEEQEEDDVASEGTTPRPTHTSAESRQQNETRQQAAAELRRSELLSLLFCVLSPIMGAYMLYWMRETMTDGNKYLNAFNIRLFTLAAGVKPWSHAMGLFRRRMLHLQEQVHYPSSKVERMNQRLRRLEADLTSLRKLYATKSEVRILRDYDAQLSRAVRRSERKEEHLRLSAEEKFSIVESRLEDLLRETAINAELIEEERRERERAASLRISLFEAVKYLLGSGLTVRRAGPKHYLHDMPRSLPSTAALGIGTGSTEAEMSPADPSAGVHSQPYVGQAYGSAVTPRGVASSAPASGLASPPGVGTPPNYSATPPPGGDSRASRARNDAGAQRSRSRSAPHRVSDPWWERGVAFYLFLPLNFSSAAIRLAGEKLKTVVEDSENEMARSQRKTLQYQKHLADQQLQQHQRKVSHQVLSPPRSRPTPPAIKVVSSPPAAGGTAHGTSSRTR